MDLTARKLLTIVTEAALEDMLVRDIEALGARGYTITDARGKGGQGKRDATWAPHANIRVEVICDADTSLAICTALRDRYSDDFSMVMHIGDVDVLRPQKF